MLLQGLCFQKALQLPTPSLFINPSISIDLCAIPKREGVYLGVLSRSVLI